MATNRQTISSRDDNKHLKHWIGSAYPQDPEAWLECVTEHQGSWVPNWIDWLKQKSPTGFETAPIACGNDSFPEIEPAPGRYVLES